MSLLPLVGEGALVPVVGGGEVVARSFDFAASAPALVEVADAVTALLPWYSSVHRGAGFLSEISTDAFEAARVEVGRFVGARPDDTVIFTRNTTDSLNLLAASMAEGTHVVLFDVEHHANLLPWRRHATTVLPTPDSVEEVAPAVARAVEGAHRGGAKRIVVAMTGASNVTGELWPVAEVTEAAHAHGARVAVDAAQLAPHGPVDLARWDADWVSLSGHKLYAPFGAGALVGRADWLAEGDPFLRGGGAVRWVTPEDVSWAALPDRQEAGSPNVLGAVALGAACRALRRVGMDVVLATEAKHAAHLAEALGAIPGLIRYRLWAEGHPRIGVVTFNLAGYDHAQVAAVLAAEHGISVRNGCFCAHPLLVRLLHVDDPDAIRAEMEAPSRTHPTPGAVRASTGISTTAADVEALADAVAALVSDGPRWAYRFDPKTGGYHPDPDDRPRPILPFPGPDHSAGGAGLGGGTADAC